MNGYKKMRCTNKMTGEFIGYLGTHNNAVAIGPKLDDASDIKWEPNGNDEYLAKETTPNDRYLGGSSGDYAGWGLWIGESAPVVRNSDGTISLKTKTSAKLFGPVRYLGVDYVKWSDTDDNQNILVCELVD